MKITSNTLSIKFEGDDNTILVPKNSLVIEMDGSSNIDVRLKRKNVTLLNINYQTVTEPKTNSAVELFNELTKIINY